MYPITIIIPTYNRANILAKTIFGYLSLPVLEVIVINDNSDQSYDFLDSINDEKLLIIKNKERLLQPSCRNIGIKHAKNDYILMGEDDVIIPKEYIIHLYNLLKNLKYDLVAGRLLNLYEYEKKEDAVFRSGLIPSTNLFDKNNITANFAANVTGIVETPFLHACSMYRKIITEKIKYREIFKGNAFREETCFYFDLYKDGYKLAFCGDVYAFHKQHKEGGGARSNLIKHNLFCIYNEIKFVQIHWDTLKKIYFLRGSKEIFILKRIIFFTRGILSSIKGKILFFLKLN